MKRSRNSFWYSLLVALIYVSQGAVAYGTIGPCGGYFGVDDCCSAETSPADSCCAGIVDGQEEPCDCLHEPVKPVQSQLSIEKVQPKPPADGVIFAEWIPVWSGVALGDCEWNPERMRTMPSGPPLRVWKQSFQI